MTRRTTWIGGVLAAVIASGCSSDARHRGYAPVGPGGSLESGGALLEGRDGHAVAPLASGQLLVVGGRTAAEAASASLERYDPQLGWSEPSFARLATPRVGHQALTLPDGRVWILGGADAQGQPLDSTELYDPAQDAVSPGPRLERRRAYAAAAVTSGQLVLAGGTSPSVEVWDLAGPSPMSATLSLPHVALRATLAPVGGAWLLAGGRDAAGQPAGAIWFDLGAGQAEAASEPLVERAPAVATGGRTFLVAGRLGERPSAAFQRVERGRGEPVFDDGYRALEVRDFPSALATDDGVLVVGGVAVDGPPQPLSRVEWVGPEGSREVDALIVARRDPTLTPLADGRIVIVGGSGVGGRPLSGVEVFLPHGGQAQGPDRLAAARQRAALEAQRQRDLAQARADLARLNQDLAALQARLAQAQADLAARDARVQALSGQVAQLTQQLAQVQQQAQAAAGQNANLQAQVADLAFRLGSANRQRDQALRERDDARQQQALLQQELQRARDQVKAAEARAQQAQAAAAQPFRPRIVGVSK